METSCALTQGLWPSKSRVWRKPMGWKQGVGFSHHVRLTLPGPAAAPGHLPWKASPGSSPLTDGIKGHLVQPRRGPQVR